MLRRCGLVKWVMLVTSGKSACSYASASGQATAAVEMLSSLNLGILAARNVVYESMRSG